ncbi:hypothetical protein ACSFB8_09640 [Enterococcus faecalis]
MAKSKEEKIARNNKFGQMIAIVTGGYYLVKMIMNHKKKNK